MPSAIRELKKVFGEDLYVITDVCLCAYTTHGHCGLVHDHHVLNDESVERLVKMALAHATAGADMVVLLARAGGQPTLAALTRQSLGSAVDSRSRMPGPQPGGWVSAAHESRLSCEEYM